MTADGDEIFHLLPVEHGAVECLSKSFGDVALPGTIRAALQIE
jgi:hypothetical protein